MPVQRLKVAILLLDLPCSGPVTYSGEILTTGKSHGKKPDRFSLNDNTQYFPRLTLIRRKITSNSNLITVQQDMTYSVYYISVGSSTCFRCWHPSSGACTTNYSFWCWITRSSTIRPHCWVGTDSCVSYSRYLPYDTHPVNQCQKL